MTTCAYRGSRILFGGVKVGERRCCNTVCHEQLQRRDHPDSPPGETADKPTVAAPPPLAQLMCGWPLILIGIGGAVGGGLGGLAYALNLQIYKSKMPLAAKIILNPLVGAAAFGGWLLVATAIASARR